MPTPGIRPESLRKLERQRDVARLYLQGQTQWEIARRFRVKQCTVSKDLRDIQDAWMASAVADFNAKKAKELARLDMIEREAWRGWRRSLRDAEKKSAKVEAKPDGTTKTSQKSTEGQAGDPRFLQVVADCVDRRLRVMGAYPKDGSDPAAAVAAEIIVRVLGPGLSMSELCGGTVLNARAIPEGQ